MPILPSGHIVGITSQRARYNAIRQNIRINKNTPHQDLYRLVDIIYANSCDSSNPWHKGYRFTGYTISDRKWLKKWKPEDRDSFLKWIEQGNAFCEIEGARKKIIYDILPCTIKLYTYPERLYSTLQGRIAAMAMSSASAAQWRNTILNMRGCGVREEEIKWSGVLDFLAEAEATGKTTIMRDDLVTRIDFSHIRLELANEMIREEACPLIFEDRAEIISARHYLRSGLKQDRDEYVVLRYVDPQFNYRIAYIRSQKRGPLCSGQWLVLDSFGKALANDDDGSIIFYSDSASAQEAAGAHAQRHYGLKSPLQPNNKYEYMGLYGGTDYREWILTLPDYQESHFIPHFTERNVLLHIRTKTRIDDKGHRILFVEEIQSDWHQQYAHKGQPCHRDRNIPHAPFRKEWALLALKLILQHAVDDDYQGVAWTPGKIQQMRHQCKMSMLLRLYDKIIPQHLIQLSRNWNGRIEQTLIITKEPWLTPRQVGGNWIVKDKAGRFVTRKKLTKQQAIEICQRHSRTIELTVPVFYIPAAMRRKIDNDALPLFGEMMNDKVIKPLCGTEGFKTCDAKTKIACKHVL